MLDVNDTLNPGYTQDGEKRLRTKVACDYCRKRKSKCNGEQPCSKCLDKNRTVLIRLFKRAETEAT